MPSTALYWCQRDLRLADNPALSAACARHERVLPIYIHAPDEEAPWAPGAASRWWLHHSLAALSQELVARGSGLVICRGDSLAELRRLVRETDASAVYWNRLYEPALRARNRSVKLALREDGLEAESFNAALLLEPWEMKTLSAGQPYRVFTPFYKAMMPRLPARALLALPKLSPPKKIPPGLALDELALLPKTPWDAGFPAHWTPGEAGAKARLEQFCRDAIAGYGEARDRPDAEGTSRLSPHLHFGEIGPVQILARCQRLMAEDPNAGTLKNAEGFLRQLIWREFAHHLLYHFPDSPQQPMTARFASLRWRKDYAADLRHWQRGATGIPIVDAGLRQLWHTGTMHNRVRMLAASLLSKNLLIPWQEGARWFWDSLVDASLANNTLGWQWVAGCGADAAPYFRVFNPVLQSRRFDPEGLYIRRWVPELAALGSRDLHAPWALPNPPAEYPAPIVDLPESRARALAAYRQLRSM